MSKRFISQPLHADAGPPAGNMEPSLPQEFDWSGERLIVVTVLRSWRSTKMDRGDVYLKRFWFEFTLPDARVATVYFDREAKPGSPHWWLYTLESPDVLRRS